MSLLSWKQLFRTLSDGKQVHNLQFLEKQYASRTGDTSFIQIDYAPSLRFPSPV